MADHSHIEWTDATWNPITGCTLVSEGCRHCYAAQLAATRLSKQPSRAGLARRNAAGEYKFTGEVRFNEQWLLQPLRWRRARTIFVNAHGDTFHERVPLEWIAKLFGVMSVADQHYFQVLTKRADRQREVLSDRAFPAEVRHELNCMADVGTITQEQCAAGCAAISSGPLPNVWLGTSVEDRPALLERAGHLRQTPAAIRFLSIEPLLADLGPVVLDGIHWVIVGGESGAGARPMHPDWARSLRDQCAAAGVPFFFKQWGACAATTREEDAGYPNNGYVALHRAGPIATQEELSTRNGAVFMGRVGKKAAGRLLDGVEHNGMPSIAA